MFSVVTRGSVSQPSISGNGKVIVWRESTKPGISEVGIQREDEQPTLLTRDKLDIQKPKTDNSGQVVAFEQAAEDKSDWDIARLTPYDKQAVVVIDTPGQSHDFDISSDGSTIVSSHRSPQELRRIDLWEKNRDTKTMTPAGSSYGTPQVAGNGETAFYVKFGSSLQEPTEIWLHEKNGGAKPVVYESGNDPAPIYRNSLDTNEDGSVLAWSQRTADGDMEIWRWNLQKGHKKKVGEAPLAGQVTVSKDGSTMAWSEVTIQDNGEWASQLLWRQGEEERIVASDSVGHNLDPSLSADGNTLVWMMQYRGEVKPNEIRKAVLK